MRCATALLFFLIMQICYISFHQLVRLAQLVERYIDIVEVTSSSLVPDTKKKDHWHEPAVFRKREQSYFLCRSSVSLSYCCGRNFSLMISNKLFSLSRFGTRRSANNTNTLAPEIRTDLKLILELSS